MDTEIRHQTTKRLSEAIKEIGEPEEIQSEAMLMPLLVSTMQDDIKTSKVPGTSDITGVCGIKNPFDKYSVLNNTVIYELMNKFEKVITNQFTVYVCCIYEGKDGLLKSPDIQNYILSNLGFCSVNLHLGYEKWNPMVYSQNLAGRLYLQTISENLRAMLEKDTLKSKPYGEELKLMPVIEDASSEERT